MYPFALLIISVYAPTLDSESEVKHSFYENLEKTINTVCLNEQLVIMGNINARVGNNSKTWKDIIGPLGIGKVNNNEDRFLQLCAKNSRFITNTNFELKDIHKGTWIHPRSNLPHIIDYVIIKQKHRRDFLITRVMRSTDGDTDHMIIRLRF